MSIGLQLATSTHFYPYFKIWKSILVIKGWYKYMKREWLALDDDYREPTIETKIPFDIQIFLDLSFNKKIPDQLCSKLCTINSALDALHVKRQCINVLCNFELTYTPIANREKCINHFKNISDQVGKTCYAHALAHAIRETEKRIIGRNPPSHDELVTEITQKYDSYSDEIALQCECKKRRLQYQLVNWKDAIAAVQSGRVVIASFFMNHGQWREFSDHFKNSQTCDKILQNVGKGYEGKNSAGHMVAIVGYGKSYTGMLYWKIKNSWGAKWGDHGYFRLSLDFNVDIDYYDVFFTLSDLTKQDLKNFKKYQNQKNKHQSSTKLDSNINVTDELQEHDSHPFNCNDGCCVCL